MVPRLPMTIAVTCLGVAFALPSPAAPPGTADLLRAAERLRAEAHYGGADSVASLARLALGAQPPGTPEERLALVDRIVACSRPVTSAGCDTIAAWAHWAAAMHERDTIGRGREEAWFSAGRAWQRDQHADSALACYERAVRTARSRFGRIAAEEADLLARVANQYLLMSRSRDMKRVADLAIETWSRAPDVDSLVLASALVPRARVHLENSELEPGRTDLDLALGIRLRRLGPDHGDLVQLWRAMATGRFLWGDPAGATQAIEEALRLAQRTRNPADPELINLHAQAASIQSSTGDFVAAVRHARAAVETSTRRYGPRGPLTAYSRLTLANALGHLGDLAMALREAREAVAIQHDVLPDLNGDRAYGLSVLAALENATGAFQDAYAHYSESARIRETLLGPGNLQTLHVLSGRAEAAEGLGRYAEADTLLERVARVQGEMGLVDEMLRNWRVLGHIKHKLGNDPAALAIVDRLVTMSDSLYGQAATARETHVIRATLLHALGREDEALDEALAMAALEREFVRLTATAVSEREGTAAEEERSEALATALAIAASPRAPSGAARRAWDELVRSRALAFRIQSERRARRSDGGPALLHALAQVDSARGALARARLEPGAAPAGLDSLRSQAEDAERALADIAPALGPLGPEPGIEATLASLGAGEKLVSFTRHGVPEPAAGAHGGEHAYVALVGDRTGRVTAVALGSAASLEERIAHWLALQARPAHDATGERALARRAREAGEVVRRDCWDPLSASLDGAVRVDVIADGALRNVDLPTLPAAGGGWLVEHGPLVAPLASERDLLPRLHEGRGLLALGAPDFESGGPPDLPLAAAVERSDIPDSVRLRFAPLPQSGEEAREIARLWGPGAAALAPPRVLLGVAASEAAFRGAAPSCEVIHLATHGFLLEGPGAAIADTSRRGVGALVGPESPRVELAGSVDASVAGLALAGANVGSAGRPAADDGILTGAEVASLDLARVRCVLLSACRTGESRADRFESLQGLERALRVAGVGQVVMSLWPVADSDAREWMRAFYGAWRTRGLGMAEAVRAADLERLHALGHSEFAPRPVRWAPFFARGERDSSRAAPKE